MEITQEGILAREGGVRRRLDGWFNESALIHHLAIGNNLPFDHLANFLSVLGYWLIVEFIPKEDPQVQRMLAYRKDIFSTYDCPSFEASFERYFSSLDKHDIQESRRFLYLMK